jgi:tetratricopeptide (TPR) repeat protein
VPYVPLDPDRVMLAFCLPLRVLLLLCSVAIVAGTARAQDDHYVGSDVCASCHRDIAASQAQTKMAQTWRGSSIAFPESRFDEGTPSSEQIHYEFQRKGNQTLFSATKGGSAPWTAPVESMIGGKRHGISFLLTLDRINGLPLERPAMLEARYALLPTGALVLSPGFPKERPQDLEHELGRVLSPTFELRCLTCHGKPGTLGAGKEGGVRCESCHGPGSAHVASARGEGLDHQQIVNPRSLKGIASIVVCAQCHNGFKPQAHTDPMPEDLLVSSQVPALRHSECFIQSGEQLTCTACHNPHEDSAAVSQSSVSVCLRCHSLSVTQHAAICPVDQKQGCIGCHMPAVQVDAFRVTDHWIRVQPELAPTQPTQNPAYRTQVIAKREFLRLISVATDEEMKAVTDRLAKGESFGSVAHALSRDQSAPAGGFIGDMALADMDPSLAAAAAHLEKGSDSDVIRVGNARLMLHRLSRDFRWDAGRLFHEAQSLNDQGDRSQAIKKAKQALDIYPYQLRGLNLMGIMLRQAGDVTRAAAVLGFAAQTYPQDAPTLFHFALVQDSPNQIEQLRRVIELDPDIPAAYRSLGASLSAAGQYAAAIETYRAGLKINPLSAVLYHDLGLALKEQGDATGASKALALAAVIDPKINARLGR